jgi:tRNA(fMet)-specific endonuclease VapC
VIIFDTDVLIRFLNGTDAALADRLLAIGDDDGALCTVVKAELLYGARASARVDENLARLVELFSLYPSLPFNDLAAEHYGVIRAQLKRLGTPIGGNDLMIAATALAHDAAVATGNGREFRRVAGLRVLDW